MNASLHRRLNRRKRRLLRRLEHQPGVERPEPMLAASNIRYELTDRTRAIAPGGIGAIHLLAQRTGLVHNIDEGLHWDAPRFLVQFKWELSSANSNTRITAF